MARSFNDFRNRRQRETLTRGMRSLMASAHEDVGGWGRLFAIAAIIFLVLGTSLRVVGITLAQRAFHNLKFREVNNTDEVIQSLNQATASIGVATDWVTFAGAATLLGFVFAWIAFVKKRYRAPWSFPVFIILAVLHLPLIPVGTLISIASLWYLVLRRHEFSPPKPVIPVSP